MTSQIKQSVDTPKPPPKPFGGTWRDHVLVKCSRCKGLMSHHIVSDDAVCVGCEIKERCDCGEVLTPDHYDHMTKGY